MRIEKLFRKFGLKALEDNQCTAKHIAEVKLHIHRWIAFWIGHKCEREAIRIPGCTRAHLEEWRRSLIQQEYATRTINKHLATMRFLLILAEKHEIIDRRPRLEQLNEINGASKLYLRDEQIDALFSVADQLRWPKVPIPSGVWWQCAMILYRTYGFRTQELVAFERSKTPITWKNVSFSPESPNPNSDSVNEFGWLWYIPPKTQKKKPIPIYLPLTRYTLSALKVLSCTRESDDSPICNNPRNADRFYSEWYRWHEIANVAPKMADKRFTPYCMRKTCATQMNRFMPGLATAVCRWGTSAEAKVASDHYISDEPILMELLNAPMPRSFDVFTASHAA